MFTEHNVKVQAKNFTCVHCHRKTVVDGCAASSELDNQKFPEFSSDLFVVGSRGNTPTSTPSPYLPVGAAVCPVIP